MKFKLIILLSSMAISLSGACNDEYEKLSKREKILAKKVTVSTHNLTLLNNSLESHKVREQMGKNSSSNIVAVGKDSFYYDNNGHIKTYKIGDKFKSYGVVKSIDNGIVTLENGKTYNAND